MADEQNARRPAEELFELAVATAEDLASRLGVEGAVVIVVRKTDMMQGCALRFNTLGIDDAFATSVKALVDAREQSVRAAQTKENG